MSCSGVKLCDQQTAPRNTAQFVQDTRSFPELASRKGFVFQRLQWHCQQPGCAAVDVPTNSTHRFLRAFKIIHRLASNVLLLQSWGEKLWCFLSFPVPLFVWYHERSLCLHEHGEQVKMQGCSHQEQWLYNQVPTPVCVTSEIKHALPENHCLAVQCNCWCENFTDFGL